MCCDEVGSVQFGSVALRFGRADLLCCVEVRWAKFGSVVLRCVLADVIGFG